MSAKSYRVDSSTFQDTQDTQDTQDAYDSKSDGDEDKRNEKETKPGMTYIRTPEGAFICPTCGVIKRRQNSMHYHMKKHLEDKSHICQYCNKSFLQKQTLELHRRSKHAQQLMEDATPPAFSCPFQDCDFRSHTKGNCVIHCLRVHFQDEITPHLRLIQDRRIYSCLHCKNEYKSTTAFYYHIKKCITFDKTTPKYALLQELT